MSTTRVARSDNIRRCMYCGSFIPAGMTFRQVYDDKGNLVGNRCFQKCKPKKNGGEVVMNENKVAYLLSFLAILVHRAGGQLVIENLSDYSKTDLSLGMDLDAANNKVTLTVTTTPRSIPVIH